ncbi:MAG: hypothetical protein LBP60_07375 [Spirochaetaceae bacterium]|jgi:hypothetical protein|nr:hypothetical protein [Spirochaetaceae bacterium]
MEAGRIVTDIIKKCGAFFSRFSALINLRSRIAVVAAAAVLVIVLLFLTLLLLRFRSGRDKLTGPPGPDAPAFSTEDFFLPYEPDFVPPVLLEREPRDGWNDEDARPFWTDPMEGAEGTWRGRIGSGIDSLLEHVP